jgi:hypothetical protein
MMKSSKREALKALSSRAKLLEIIDAAYDHAESCQNCKALSEWWEKHGSEMPTDQVVPNVQKPKRR